MRFFAVLICAMGYLLASEVHAVDDSGVVQQITGDLAFVTGLNGAAPLGSQLQVDNGSGLEGPTLQVIKKLEDDVLVARVVVETGSPLKVSDRIRVVTTVAAESALRAVYALGVDKGPVIDGRLDDAVWQKAKPIEGFLQSDPGYWEPSTERTVARVIYDNSKIYIGFECYDSEPDKIVANNMRRDSDVFGDDNVQILLDTYNDRQTGVFFFVNSLGAQRDVILSREGRTYNDDWDCVWEAKAHRHDKGWSAEVAIPFDQLRFKEEENAIWGINLARFIARKNEETALMVGPKSATSFSRYRTTDIAELRGLRSLKTKRVFQIKPYVLPGAVRDLRAADPSAKTSFESGVDVRYGVTPNMTLDLSYNTDFAQVEGDQEQVNLTQFSQFFPEKREFFLEGATLFDFGESAARRGGDSRPPTILFYSRRIGLESGQPVPILLGSKLGGKAGKTRIGVLNVLTDGVTFQNGTTVQRSNFSVLRVKQDVLGRSNIGAIFVNKQTHVLGSGWDAYNRAAGVDFSFSPTNILNFQGFYARTWDPAIGDTDDARFLQATYSGAVYSGTVKFMDVEENFEPKAGYVNRRAGLRGLRRYEGDMRARIPSNIGLFQYYLFSPRARFITDRNNNVKFWDVRIAEYTRFRTGDWYRLVLTRTHDVVERTFKPSKKRPHIIIPHGTYNFTKFSTGPFPSRSRKIRPEFDFEFGTYYTGKRYKFSLENAFKPSGQLSIETDYEVNWVRLPEGNFNIQALSSRLIYSFSTDLYMKLFTQWNNDTESVGVNFLMNYRFRPGSDIYLVYDQGFDTLNGLDERNRALLVKVSYMMGM
jgi:hypothetical protein